MSTGRTNHTAFAAAAAAAPDYQECPANGSGPCSITPCGPNGLLQCEWCGSEPAGPKQVSPTTKTYSFEDGKYGIERDTKTGLTVLMRRNGAIWGEGMNAFAHVKLIHAMLNLIDELQAPVNMVLYCPNCGTQHIDAPEGPSQRAGDSPTLAEGMAILDGTWTNPPHRSHLCHACGCTWRPADVPTNGVAAITTAGKADTWVVNAEEIDAQRAVK